MFYFVDEVCVCVVHCKHTQVQKLSCCEGLISCREKRRDFKEDYFTKCAVFNISEYREAVSHTSQVRECVCVCVCV
ncbi:Hypothetical predicted protein [Xyrichtys novacula]|nr:Hypothetical predicted protein [Xyrichtys novacula]